MRYARARWAEQKGGPAETVRLKHLFVLDFLLNFLIKQKVEQRKIKAENSIIKAKEVSLKLPT